ncbi:MAG: hypothetical protein ACRCZ2_12410 [Fusobacteriaceae bacterium]
MAKSKKKKFSYTGNAGYDRALSSLVMEYQATLGYIVRKIKKTTSKFEGDFAGVYSSLRRDDPLRGYKSLTDLFQSKGKEVEIKSVSTSASQRILDILSGRPSLKDTNELESWKMRVFTELRENFMKRDGLGELSSFFRVVDLLESSEYYLSKGFYKVRTPECPEKDSL